MKKETFFKEDTKYKKHCTQDNNASVPFKVGTLEPHTVLLTAVRCSFCSGSRSCRTNFATTCFMPRSCVKISHSSFQNPQISFQFSHCQLPIFVDCSLYTFSILRCSAHCRPSRTWITFNRFLTILEAFVPHFYLHCTHCIIPQNLLSHLNSFHRGILKLITRCDADLLLYSLSHFACDDHTVHMLIQCLPSPTIKVKPSLLTHAHSSPLSLAARLHGCHANRSPYSNNGGTFSRQTLYVLIFLTK